MDNMQKLVFNQEARICDSCILPEGYPDTTFSECNNRFLCRECREIETNPIDREKLKRQLVNCLQKIIKNREKRDKYDAVLAYSGGKDSTAALYLAIKRYKLNVLAFTIDHGLKGKKTMKNIQNVVQFLGVDWYHIHLDISEEFRACFERFELPCEVCHQHMRNFYNLVPRIFQVNTVITGSEIPYRGVAIRYGTSRSGFPRWKNIIRTLINTQSRCSLIQQKIKDKLLTHPLRITNINLLAALSLNENDILRIISTLPWEDPNYSIYDSE